jgi:cysteine desulfurase
MKRIYLDHNATTPLDPLVLSGLPAMAQCFGNPSSIHWSGREPKALIREARQNLAKGLGVSPMELVFTSGATEASNSVIESVFNQFKNTDRNVYVTSQVEHPSVRESFLYIQSQGAEVHFLSVSREGVLDMESLQKILNECASSQKKLALVSVMFANNETGTVFPISRISSLVHQAGGLMHSDCVQALGKISFDMMSLGLDYASFSAHKMYALKGIGALYIKRGSPYSPLLRGGAQERHRRGGTENTLGIWSFGLMASRLSEVAFFCEKMQSLRDEMEEKIKTRIEGVRITAGESLRLPNTSSMTIEGVDGETLLMNLDIKGVAVSTGAACSSGSPEPSPVLLAMGLSRLEAQSSLRLSLGWESTAAEIEQFVQILESVVQRLRNLNSGSEVSL